MPMTVGQDKYLLYLIVISQIITNKSDFFRK
jgi:hypothetical protein